MLHEPSVSVSIVLGHWQSDPLSRFGLALEILAVIAYLFAWYIVHLRGRPWLRGRAVAFIAGIVLVALALQSGFSRYDDTVFWVHTTQHLVLMMAAPPLLAAGAPVTLALAVLGPTGRRRLMGVLRDPSMRLVDGPAAAVLLPLDYYGSMVIFMLTPLYRESEVNAAFHAFVHFYFLACGLFLWVPLIALDPVRWRPSYHTKLLLVAAGAPVYVILGALVAAEGRFVSPAHPLHSLRLGAEVTAGLGTALCLLGIVVIRAREQARLQSSRTRVPSW